MLQLTLMDGAVIEISREEAREILPYRHVCTHKLLKSPIDALLAHRGELIPVLGPLPEEGDEAKPVDERPWILLLEGCAQVICGLPNFMEEAAVIPLGTSPETPSIDREKLPA